MRKQISLIEFIDAVGETAAIEFGDRLPKVNGDTQVIKAFIDLNKTTALAAKDLNLGWVIHVIEHPDLPVEYVATFNNFYYVLHHFFKDPSWQTVQDNYYLPQGGVHVVNTPTTSVIVGCSKTNAEAIDAILEDGNVDSYTHRALFADKLLDRPSTLHIPQSTPVFTEQGQFLVIRTKSDWFYTKYNPGPEPTTKHFSEVYVYTPTELLLVVMESGAFSVCGQLVKRLEQRLDELNQKLLENKDIRHRLGKLYVNITDTIVHDPRGYMLRVLPLAITEECTLNDQSTLFYPPNVTTAVFSDTLIDDLIYGLLTPRYEYDT